MREVELKSVVDDLDLRRKVVESAGGVLGFEGKLIDVRYGDREGKLVAEDQVLRLRVYESEGKTDAHLDWKGPTQYEDGYKVREELSTRFGDPAVAAAILENLGYSPTQRIERFIWQYWLFSATVRFERYPVMDDLVEVEGDAASIEKAISLIGLPREGFTAGRLTDFVASFEARTGKAARLSE